MSAESVARLSRYQILVLFVAWLGWIFDSMDSTIYTIVLTPALRELLGTRATPENIASYGSIILSIFLVGWAVGGALFGILADTIGRTRTLVITILIYAVFTGLAGFSHTWWELAIYRFITALGIGGEWAAGATLVAEVWPESLRVRGAGFLQSAWGAGYFLAAGIGALLSHRSWRVMFFVGLAPALVALLVRVKVREPERWRAARQAGGPRFTVRELFRPEHRRDTLVGAALALVAVFGLWGATNWTPSFIRELLSPQRLDPSRVNQLTSYAVMSLATGSFAGYFAFAPLAERIGRRLAFLVMLAGCALVLPVTFLAGWSYNAVLFVLPALGFFTNGIFSGFPVYLPELFPTRIRATGAGFCFNAGRVLAASGPLLLGHVLLAQLGSYARALSSIAVIYVCGMVVLLFARETRGQALE
ncbi:MAG TPA: MFS transporter [Bryobacteraceae bacterium]|nr:MFS transporter [Bryobacteraceae bacterium]